MNTIERPRFEDCTGHNDSDECIYADALDEYSTKLERYADQLEECYKSIELDNKILRNFEENVVRYGKSVELALKMAIGDAMPYVSEWGMIADDRGKSAKYAACIRENKSYISGIVDFYKMLAFDEMIEAELKKECDK